MMKKFASLLLSIVFLFTIASPCFATSISPEEIDANLLQRGFPSEALARMDITQKQTLYENPEYGYMGSFSLNYSENMSNADSQGDIQPYGQISTSDLTLTFDLACSVSDGKLNQILIFFYYTWDNLPIWRWEDPIALSWDDTKFRLKDNSFYKIDKCSFYTIDLAQQVTYYNDQIHSLETGYAQASPSGVSWYADLKSDIPTTLMVTELYGYGCLILQPAHGVTVPEGTSSTIYAHYVHPTASLGSSIAVGSFGNFDISCTGAYDERGKQHTFIVFDPYEE